MISGFFTDGRSATRHAVTLGASGNDLVITGDAVSETWPVSGIRRSASYTADEPRFQLAGSDARLMLTREMAGRLAIDLPDMFRRRSSAPAIIGIAALAAVAIGTAAVVFVFAPALSGPLARATPLHVEQSLATSTRQIVGLITRPCTVPAHVSAAADTLVDRLAEVAGSPFPTDLRFVSASFPNAFAMPGGGMIVTDDLVAMLDSPDQLAGVLAHETAHVARRHVMAAVIREMGGAMVLDLLLGGGSGAGQQIALAGLQFQSLSHSRDTEEEADRLAINYMVQIGVDPMGLPAFFERIADEVGEAPDTTAFAELVGSHPSSRRRAQTARDLARAAMAGSPATVYRPAMDESAWQALKDACR